MMNTTSSGLPGTELGYQFAGEVQRPPAVLVQVITVAEARNAGSMPRHTSTVTPARRNCLIFSRMLNRIGRNSSQVEFSAFNSVSGVFGFDGAGRFEALSLTD